MDKSESRTNRNRAGGEWRRGVGPSRDYDVSGASQFALLYALGLRDTDRLCDVGCGSLRAGRLFVSYLQAEQYFGIEPDVDLLNLGIQQHLVVRR